MTHPISLPVYGLPGRISLPAIGYSAASLGAGVLLAPLAWWLGPSRGLPLWFGGCLGALCLSRRALAERSLLSLVGALARFGALVGVLCVLGAIARQALAESWMHNPARGINLVWGAVLAPLLGWIPGLLCGLALGLVFVVSFAGLLSPWMHLLSYPSLQAREWMMRRAGAWLLGMSAVSLLVSWGLGGPALALPAVIAGAVMFRAGELRVSSLAVWLRAVQEGRVARWRVVPLPAGHASVPLLQGVGVEPSSLLLYLEEAGASSLGPYRAAPTARPVARL